MPILWGDLQSRGPGGSGNAGIQGGTPRAGSAGAVGADADADETAGGVTVQFKLGAGTGHNGDSIPGIAVDQVFGRNALQFIVAAIGDTAPAEAELAGKGAGLAHEAGGGADRLGGSRHAAQGPAGADEGFIGAVMVFTGKADAAEVVLRSGDFRIEGGADGFALLFQAGEGGKQGAEARFRGGKETDFGRKAREYILPVRPSLMVCTKESKAAGLRFVTSMRMVPCVAVGRAGSAVGVLWLRVLALAPRRAAGLLEDAVEARRGARLEFTLLGVAGVGAVVFIISGLSFFGFNKIPAVRLMRPTSLAERMVWTVVKLNL